MIAAILFTALMFGQTGAGPSNGFAVIHGWVIGPFSAPLDNVTVAMKKAGKPAVTVRANARGEFTWQAPTLGNYVVTIKSPGYTPVRRRAVAMRGAVDDLGQIRMQVDRPCPLPRPFPSKVDGAIGTTLCEIMKAPELFNGKLVQFRAIVAAGFEQSLLTDGTNEIWLDYASLTRRDSELEKMDQYLSAHYDPPGIYCPECKLYTDVTVDAVGLFEYADTFSAFLNDLQWKGFGHMNRYEARLVLQSVSNVEAKPNRD